MHYLKRTHFLTDGCSMCLDYVNSDGYFDFLASRMTALAWSIKNGDLDEVKKAVSESNVNDNIEGGRKAIHYAADYGQDEVILYLLSKGADINAVDNHGLTALLTAIYEGHASTVKLLLSRGANVGLVSPDGRRYVECAESPEIRDLLLQT